MMLRYRFLIPLAAIATVVVLGVTLFANYQINRSFDRQVIYSESGTQVSSIFDGIEPTDYGRYIAAQPESFVAKCGRKNRPETSLWSRVGKTVVDWVHPASVNAQPHGCYGRYISFYTSFCSPCSVQSTETFGAYNDGYAWDYLTTPCDACVNYTWCYVD